MTNGHKLLKPCLNYHYEILLWLFTKPVPDATYDQRAKFIRLDMFSSNFTLYIYHS